MRETIRGSIGAGEPLPEPSLAVLLIGGVPLAAAEAAAEAPAEAEAEAPAEAEAEAPAEAEAEAAAATALLAMVEEQTTTVAPPPLAEPLHWSIVTMRAEAIVPVAVQVRPAPPPLAEPLHCVIAALVVACTGLQLGVMLAPEPTHWFTVTAVEPGLTPTKLVVISTEQRSLAPPPLADPSH
jgi:hypothetical protein